MSLNDFYVGQEVSFVTENNYVPNWNTPLRAEDGKNYIKHGSTRFKENKGTVKYVGKFIFVAYIDEVDREVCLGFQPNDLKPLTTPIEKGETNMTLNPIVAKVYADSKLSDVQLIEKHIVPQLQAVINELVMTANKDAILKMAIDMEEGETILKAKIDK